MNVDVTRIIVQLLNISIQFEKLEIPHNIRLIIRNKLDILQSMAIEAMNLLRIIKEDKKSKIHVSIKIAEYYKRFQLRYQPTQRGRLRADRSSALCLNTNPHKPHIF